VIKARPARTSLLTLLIINVLIDNGRHRYRRVELAVKKKQKNSFEHFVKPSATCRLPEKHPFWSPWPLISCFLNHPSSSRKWLEAPADRVHPARESKEPLGFRRIVNQPRSEHQEEKKLFEHNLALSVILSANLAGSAASRRKPKQAFSNRMRVPVSRKSGLKNLSSPERRGD
jgi:hypothetical protein